MGRHEFNIDSTWHLIGKIDEIQSVLEDPLSLTEWWSPVFMKGELLSQTGGDLENLTARFYTKGLLPHTFQFTARIIAHDKNSGIEIHTWGDFDGIGTISALEHGEETYVSVNWTVLVRQPYLRPLLQIFKPIFVANHRWAMRRGHEGLQAEIYRRRDASAAEISVPRIKPTFPHNLKFMGLNFKWCRDSGC